MKSSVFFKAAPLALVSGAMLLGASSTASAQLTGGNVTAVTNPDVATTPYETPVTVDIMGNDEGSIADIIANNPDSKVDMNLAVPNDGNPITGKKITTAEGTYVLNDDHTVTYTPAAGITGERTPVYYYYTVTTTDPVTGEVTDTYNTQVTPITITVGEPTPTTTAPTTAEPSTTAPTPEPSTTAPSTTEPTTPTESTTSTSATPTENSTTPAPTTSTTEPTATPTTDEPSTTTPVPSTSTSTSEAPSTTEPTTPTESTSTSATPTETSSTPAPTTSTTEPTASSTDEPTPSSSSSSSTSESPTASSTATDTPSASSTESSTEVPTASSSSDDDPVISKPTNTDTEIKEKIEGPIIQTDNVSSDSLSPLGLGLGGVGVLGGAAAVALRRRR